MGQHAMPETRRAGRPLGGAFARFPKIYLCCAGLFLLAVAVIFIQPNLSSGTLRLVLGVLFQWLMMAAGILLLGRYLLTLLKGLGYQKKELLLFAGVALLLCLAGLVFLYLYFSAERDIKVYDSITYWSRTLQGRSVLENSIPQYLSDLRASLSTEYSYLIAFPLAAASYVFGSSFAGYCQSVFFAYYLPSCLFLAVLALRLVALSKKQAMGRLAFIVCLAACVLCPVLLWPVVLGYADVAGVLLVALLLNVCFDWDGAAFTWKRNLLLAFLSLVLLLARRWYAYYIIGFNAALGITALVRMLAGKSFTLKKLGALAANFGMVAAMALLGIVALNRDIFTLFLGTDYAEAYAAFKVNGPALSLWYLATHVGVLFCIVFFLGVVRFLQKEPSRFAGLQILLPGVIASALFLLVQDMGPHHQYLLVPTVLIFIAAYFAFWVREVKRKDARAVGAGLLLVFTANMAFAYVPAFAPVANFAAPLTTGIHSYPKQLANYDAYHQMHADLLERTQNQAATVYIVGEGEVLNPEYFRRIDMPAQDDAAAYAVINCTADLRDGFPSQLFSADYVLMADPFSTDFTDIQQVGYQVYEMLLSDDPVIAEHYQLVESYPLEGHQALLYQKTRPADKALVDVLQQRLEVFYPETPFVYEPTYFLSLMEFDTSMVYYNFWERYLIFQKTADAPVRFTLNDTASFSSLSFELDSGMPGLELVVEDQSGEVYRGAVDQGRAAYQAGLQGSEELTIRIEGAGEGRFSLYFQPDSLR